MESIKIRFSKRKNVNLFIRIEQCVIGIKIGLLQYHNQK